MITKIDIMVSALFFLMSPIINITRLNIETINNMIDMIYY